MAQVPIVTGGSRGIGAATAVLAAEQGYNVAFSFLRDKGAADTTLAKLRSRGVACLAEKVDDRAAPFTHVRGECRGQLPMCT